jgi:hypothetical protein
MRTAPRMATLHATTLRAILSATILVFSAAPCLSLDWPVAVRTLTGTFGENRGDHFHNGIDIGGGSQDVHPVMAGELVFRYDETSDYSSLPRGLGTFVVLRHSQNVLSEYCHLASGTLGPVKESYGVADTIGILGETGHAQGPHLHFALYDEEAGSMVNPLALLPSLADNQPPMIRRVILAVGDQRQILTDGATIRSGKVDILADVFDLREDVRFSWPLAPYSVLVSIDGDEVARIYFDTLQVQGGRTVLGAHGPPREGLYDTDGLIRCATLDLRAGSSHLRITLRDFAGNETVKELALTVQE